MLRLIKDIHTHRELLGILVVRNLKIRYKRSVLGFFWTLLTPLFFILIYAVFLKLLKSFDSNPVFLPSLVAGVVVWQFLAMCLGDSLHAILGNATLVTKAAFPRIVLPLSMAIANTINFLLSTVILIVYLLILKLVVMPEVISFQYAWLLPIVLVTQFALCLGLSLILSSLNVFFRDTEHILGVGLLAWFFLTPIIYTFDRIPQEFQRYSFLNPMTGIVTAFRTGFLGTSIVAPRLVTMSLGIAWVVLLIGILMFQMLQSRFAEEL
jgi:lipopolysaccharide transport system permease protein